MKEESEQEKKSDEQYLKKSSLAHINADPAMTATGNPRPKGATAKPEGS